MRLINIVSILSALTTLVQSRQSTTSATPASSTNAATGGVPDPELEMIAREFDPSAYTIKREARAIFTVDHVAIAPAGPHPDDGENNSGIGSLTSRQASADEYYKYQITNGLLSGNPALPVVIGQPGRHEFLEKAKRFGDAAKAANAPPNATSPARYFKFTEGNFSFIMVAKSKSLTYDWYDYARVAAGLAYKTADTGNFTNDNRSLVVTGNDKEGSSQIWGALINSFRVEKGRSSESDSTPTTSAGPTTGVGDGGGRRLRRRRDLQPRQDSPTYTLRFGPGNQFKLRLVAATTQVSYGLLASLVNSAYNQLVMDTPSSLVYSQQVSEDWIPKSANFPGNLFQFYSKDGIHPDLYQAALMVILKFADRYRWSQNAGLRAAFSVDILDTNFNILATIGLGIKAVGPLNCQVNNPDGSIVLGCLRRDEL